jgi:Cohesin domain
LRVHRNRGIRATVAATSLVLATLGGTATAMAADGMLRIDPSETHVAKGATFDVRVIHRATTAVSGAQATITFDPAVVRIVAVSAGEAYAQAPIFLGAASDAIDLANTTGRLTTVAAAFLPPLAVPPGDQDVLLVRFEAIACGDSELGLPVGPADAALISGTASDYGRTVEVATVSGSVAVCSPSPTTSGASALGSSLLLIALLGLAVAAAIGLGLRSMRRDT